MDELTQLANALMALDDKLAACMKCGFCQAFCPMYMTTRIEGDLTRGKIALVENLAHRIIEDPEAAVPPLRLVPGKLPFGRENDRHFP